MDVRDQHGLIGHDPYQSVTPLIILSEFGVNPAVLKTAPK
jgi:hypothetical protein